MYHFRFEQSDMSRMTQLHICDGYKLHARVHAVWKGFVLQHGPILEVDFTGTVSTHVATINFGQCKWRGAIALVWSEMTRKRPMSCAHTFTQAFTPLHIYIILHFTYRIISFQEYQRNTAQWACSRKLRKRPEQNPKIRDRTKCKVPT